MTAGRRATARPHVSVLSTAHDVADARLHRICAALLRRGLTVEVVGLGSAPAGPPGTDVHTMGERPGPARRMGRALALPLRARGSVVLTLDPDLVPAAVLRRMLRRGVTVVDVHEDYAAVLHDRAWAHGIVGLGGRAVAAASSTLASHADLTVVADDYLPPLQARHRLVVRNLPDLSALPAAGARPASTGAVRRRRSRLPRPADHARRDRGGTAVDPRRGGPVAAGDQDWLDGWTRRSPGADRVRMHGRLGPRDAWAFAEGAWVGLMLLEETPAFVETIPTKVYEYLACGLAVLATPLPRAAELLRTSGAGRVVRDAPEVAAALTDWSDHPDSLDRHRTAARAWSAENLAGGSPYDELADAVAGLLPAATG